MWKLSGWVWIVVGVFAGGAILGYSWFQHYGPDKVEAENLNTYADQLEAEYRKESAAQKRIDQAIEDVEQMARDWNAVVDVKMRNDDAFIDLTVDPYQLVVNAPKYRDKVQRAVNRQVKSGGVIVVQGPTVPTPGGEPGLLSSYFNYGGGRLPFPVVVFELGTVTIRGSLRQIMANVEAWSDMPDYFAVADGLAITGTDNELTATYNVVILGYLPGPASGPLGPASGIDLAGLSEDLQELIDNAGLGSGGAPPPPPGGRGDSIPSQFGGSGSAAGN